MNKIKKIHSIAVIYNAPLVGADKERSMGDIDTVLTAKEVAEALIQRGYEVCLKEMTDGEDDLPGEVDLVYNMCEWTNDETYKSCRVLERLEGMNKAYTGASSKNYFETSDKLTMKKLMRAFGLRTPGWQVVEDYHQEISPKLKYPLIVKLVNEHGSVGISQNSVVENEENLRGQMEFMIRKYKQPVIIEEFIVGRELNATLIGNGKSVRVLPITEMDFGESNRKWNILTFSSKFLDRTDEYKDSKPFYPAYSAASEIFEKTASLAKKAFLKFQCQDYARMDIRVDREGNPWLLEINSNPSLENAWISSMVSAKVVGWGYEEIIENIALVAWSRYLKKVNNSTNEDYDFVQYSRN